MMRLKFIPLLAVLTLVLPNAGSAQNTPIGASDPARFQMVTCRLPPQTRKMGSAMMFTVPGQVLRIDLQQCEQRGGEYVTPDSRGKLCAEIGRIEQTANTGEVNAMRLLASAYEAVWDPDCAPRPELALRWYEKAAEKGDKLSAIALARFYAERGDSAEDRAKSEKYASVALGVAFIAAPNPELDALRSKVKHLEERQRTLERERDRIGTNQDRKLAIIQEISQTILPAQASSSATLEISAAKIKVEQLLSPQFDRRGPQIIISEPFVASSSDVSSARIPISALSGDSLRVEGKLLARDAGRAATLFTINGKPTTVTSGGNFKQQVNPLAVTETVVFEATMPDGQTAVRRLKVVDSSERLTHELTAIEDMGNSHALFLNGHSGLGKTRFDELARALANRYAFAVDVLRGKDVTAKEILIRVAALRQRLSPSDQLIVFYSGEASLDTNRQCLWRPQPGAEAISTEKISAMLESLNVQQILVVTDACYSRKLSQAVLNVRTTATEETRGLAVKAILKQRARLAMMAEQDGQGGELLAGTLAEILIKNGGILLGTELSLHLNNRLASKADAGGAGGAPTVEYGGLDQMGHRGGDFVFAPRAAKKTEANLRRIDELPFDHTSLLTLH